MKLNSILRGVTIGLLVFLIFNVGVNTGAQLSQVDAYVGSIESDEIEEGESIQFTGSVYNLGNVTIWVFTFNVTFIELLGQSSIRDPKLFDFSKVYPKDSVILDNNDIYSDSFSANIDLNPGKYNVSIGFTVFSASVADDTLWENRYALVNQTVEVIGTSQSIDIARNIGYFLLGITGLLIVYYIYTKFRK